MFFAAPVFDLAVFGLFASNLALFGLVFAQLFVICLLHCHPTKHEAENFLGSEPGADRAWCALSPHVLGNKSRWTRSPPSKIGRATRAPLRQRLHAHAHNRQKAYFSGLYAVGVFRLNKVGGFVFEGDGDKKQLDVEY